jgi:hypothetical protein
VLVAGLRCDGTAHDGCQARCYLLWKTAWLERVAAQAAPVGQPSTDCAGILELEVSAASIAALPILGAGEEEHRTYMCQYTEIVRASSELSPSDPRQDLRPLIAGNITMTAFGVAMLTRLFNAAQRLRGGSGYPPSRPNLKPASGDPPLELHPGDLVRVANPEKIFVTLDKSGKNRGLWFDRDMLKHCGRTYRVLYRANKLIDDATRRMRRMKSPCIVLEDLDVSGEYLRFCAQHDYPFWREDWLERVESGGRRCGPGLGLRSAGAPAQSAARAPDHRKAYGGIENPSGEQRGRAL